MIAAVKKLPRLFVLFLCITVSGYGGFSIEKIPDCITKTSIYSTPDMLFYSIKDESNRSSYTSLKIKKDELVMCYHHKGGSIMDQCDDHEYLGYRASELPESITITFDGMAYKNKAWGIEKIFSGSSIDTYFRGHFIEQDKKQTIWINSYQLMWMFESQSDFKSLNQDSYQAFALSQRMPPPIQRTADGTPIEESWQQHFEIERNQIANWNCDLKPDSKTESGNTTRTPKTLETPLNEGIEVLGWGSEACKVGEPCLNTSFTILKNSNSVAIAMTGAKISSPSEWKLIEPNAFPINIAAGGKFTVGKKLISASALPADGGQISLKLNDGSTLNVH